MCIRDSLSALDGDNVVEKSERTPWYEGTSLLDFLETVPIHTDRNMTDFRYPVQYVLRPNLDFRGFCGKIASGAVSYTHLFALRFQTVEQQSIIYMVAGIPHTFAVTLQSLQLDVYKRQRYGIVQTSGLNVA